MKECCRRYLDDGYGLLAEWADAIIDDPGIGSATKAETQEVYRECIRDHARLCREILAGKPCPWHDRLEQFSNYLAVMDMLDAGASTRPEATV